VRIGIFAVAGPGTGQAGAGGGIKLTGATARSARAIGLAGVRFWGMRFDRGPGAGLLRASLHLAAQDARRAGVWRTLPPRLAGRRARPSRA
jgi:UTP-glucose-1-phosphate uridylyltransferase